MAGPKKNVAYEFDIVLVDSASPGSFKAAPTIAAGDFKVSTDNSSFTNLATLPSVDPGGSIAVKINLSASEMNGDKIMVQCIDAAGAEWDDKFIFIDATAVTGDDLVRATTPANTLDVDASGEVTAENMVGTNNALLAASAPANFGDLAIAAATGEVDADVAKWLGTALATPTVPGVPEVDVTYWIGTLLSTPITSGVVNVNIQDVRSLAWALMRLLPPQALGRGPTR